MIGETLSKASLAIVAVAAFLCATASPSVALATNGSACTVVGTSGNDVLVVTSANDVICGLAGNDTINGAGGNDVIYGGTGNDTIWGGPGNDVIYGDTGKDLILGESGRDKIGGGAGNDMISGGSGKDMITTNAGADTCQWDATDQMKDSCKFDKTAPVVALANPSSLSFEAGTTATFTWSASDSSGVEASWINIGGPTGWITSWCGFVITAKLVQGTAQTGEYAATCDIPAAAPNHVYSVFFNTRDFMGNITTSSATDFSVTGGSNDTTAPTFELISAPAQVQAGTTFEVSWSSSDETEVAYSAIYLASSGASFSDGTALYISAEGAPQISCVDAKHCTYNQTFLVNPDAPISTYSVWSVSADSLGNKSFNPTQVLIDVIR